MSVLRVVHARGLAAARLGRLGAGLLAQELGAATLLVAELQETTVLLGRHQRAASAVHPAAIAARGWDVARRLGGGKAILVTPGTIALQLVVPPGSPVGAGAAAAGAERAINRLVRGLLRGLPAAGAARGAFYFGRDFVSADHKQVAIVSQDGTPGGTILFEAFVASATPLALPDGISAYPSHGDERAGGPVHTCLAELGGAVGARDFASVAAAIESGYAQVTGATLERVELDALAEGEAIAPPVVEDGAGFAWSGVADAPIGFVEAEARLDGRGRIAEARLRGDFIAPAFVVRALETSLVGAAPTFAAVAPRVDAALKLPGATIVGVTQLRVLADAFVACAQAE